MGKRKAEQTLPADDQQRPAGPRRSARLRGATAAAAAVPEEEEQQQQQQQQPIQHRSAAGSAPVTASPFRRLAIVELQLIMQHCDFQTLLALARCSRFTLQAASNAFAWRALSPLSFPTTAKGLGAHLRGSRLLSHCGVALRWLPPTENWGPQPVDDAELAAIESVPRLIQLDVRRGMAGSAQLQRLLSHPALASLTALHSDVRQMDDSCVALLPLHQPRLRTLSLDVNPDFGADHRRLSPLALLPSLTDLSLSGSIDESFAEIIGRCASLRRLHFSGLYSAVLFAVLAAPARARLESLSLNKVYQPDDIPAQAADGDSWRARFENLQSLRSLSLRQCDDFDVIIAGLAAALATGTALRSLTALRADTLKMDNADGSLIPLLAAHCPHLLRLHVHEMTVCGRYNPGALAGLPLLSGLTDLRLQCGSRPSDEVELAVGRCAALTRLHLNAIRRSSLHSILRSPQLQRLESLTLGSVQFCLPVHVKGDDDDDDDEDEDKDDEEDAVADGDLDWSVCFANLRSLRSLDLDGCDGGDRLLAAVQAACPPLLCSMRFIHWGSRSISRVVPPLQLLPALLVQLPALRVELFKKGPPGASDWAFQKTLTLDAWHDAWHELKRQHTARVTITRLTDGDSDPFGSWAD